jgi:hypothetical protein
VDKTGHFRPFLEDREKNSLFLKSHPFLDPFLDLTIFALPRNSYQLSVLEGGLNFTPIFLLSKKAPQKLNSLYSVLVSKNLPHTSKYSNQIMVSYTIPSPKMSCHFTPRHCLNHFLNGSIIFEN